MGRICGLLLAVALVITGTAPACGTEQSDPEPSVFVAIYEVACGVTVPESRCAGALVDSLLSWGIVVYLASELPVTTTVPPELRDRIFGEDAAASAKLAASMSAAGGFNVTTETSIVSWADLDLHKWPWTLDDDAVMAAAKKKGCTHVLHGAARAAIVATDLSDTGLDEVVSVRGSLAARLASTEKGMLKASYGDEVAQVSTSCVLGAGKCFSILGAGAAEKLRKTLTK